MARSRVLAVMVLVSALGAVTFADVKTEEKTFLQLEGMLGGMARMFGGKAAREGLVTTVAVQGDRMARAVGDTAEIVDLAEEKVYQLDLKKKTYAVLTFEQMRQQREATLRQLEEQTKASKNEDESQDETDEGGREIEVDFTVNETGQHKTIAAYECRELVSTVTVREKGKTLEEGGGLVLTSSMWMAPTIPALEEIHAFQARYAQKLAGPAMLANAQQLMAAMALYPGLQDAMARAGEEAGKLEGTALFTSSRFETVASAQQMAERQQARDESEADEVAPKSVGGLGGLLGKKLMKKQAAAQGSGAGQRRTVLTTTTEYLKIATIVAPGDVAIPDGFRERAQ